DELQKDISQFRDLSHEYETQIGILQEEKTSKKHASEQYQEKLIREGNSITLHELSDLKKLKVKLSADADNLRTKLKDLLDLAPFAIAGNVLNNVKEQLQSEIEYSQSTLNPEALKRKIKKIQKDLVDTSAHLHLSTTTSKKLSDMLE